MNVKPGSVQIGRWIMDMKRNGITSIFHDDHDMIQCWV